MMSRLEEQQKHLNLPILPTTSIGSFPQTLELRRVRREFKANKYGLCASSMLSWAASIMLVLKTGELVAVLQDL